MTPEDSPLHSSGGVNATALEREPSGLDGHLYTHALEEGLLQST